MLRVMIVDDHPAVREGVKVMLDLSRHAHLFVGEYATFAEALEAMPRTRPTLVLADVRVPGMSAIEFLARARRMATVPAVLFMSAFCQREEIRELLRGGAAGFMTKSLEMGEFTDAIQAIAESRVWVSEEALDELLHGLHAASAHAR